MQEFLIATGAAVLAGIILAGLTLIASSSDTIKSWFSDKPWAIAGLFGFGAAAFSLVIAMVLISFFYKAPEIKISVVADVPISRANFLTNAADNKICVFSGVAKNHGEDAGSAEIIHKPDHWELNTTDGVKASATCYEISIAK